jgi:hypothetical protein
VERQFLEIQQAHTAQNLYVQKLQESLATTQKTKGIVKKQEVVISKMEELLTESHGALADKVALVQENDTLKSNLRLLENALAKQHETSMSKGGSSSISSSSTGGPISGGVQSLAGAPNMDSMRVLEYEKKWVAVRWREMRPMHG